MRLMAYDLFLLRVADSDRSVGGWEMKAEERGYYGGR